MTFWDYSSAHPVMVLLFLICQLLALRIAAKAVTTAVRGSVAKKLGPVAIEKGQKFKVTI